MMNAKNNTLSSDGGRRKHWSLSNWSLIASLVIALLVEKDSATAATGSEGKNPATVAPCVTWQPTSDQWRKQVEADWLVQLRLRGLAQAPPGRTATMDDAAGGVDGIKNGRWGFMTGVYPQWWQVDLGASKPLARVLIFNRCDGCGERASKIAVLLSDDAKNWKQAYQHNGTVFGGIRDNKPLSVDLKGAKARFVRLQIPTSDPLHLDEVEVYGTDQPSVNIALNRPADESGTCGCWSREWHVAYSFAQAAQDVIDRGRKLALRRAAEGADVAAAKAELETAATHLAALAQTAPEADQQVVYFQARWAVRKMTFASPLLNFDKVLFVQRSPGTYSHMSDQNYGWWSRPGGGICVLENFRQDRPQTRMLQPLPQGCSYNYVDVSYDGKKVLFSWCKHYANLDGDDNKFDKSHLAEDGFYHLFEINANGTGLRALTGGKYDDFDGRYLPDGRILFLSTRRGRGLQVGRASAQATTQAALGDSYVRCGGGPQRPVAVYTLHTMNADGGGIRGISAFESFEWTPSVASDGRILYSRWDYVDRSNGPFMKLWATNPDGTNPHIVWGNDSCTPNATFEPRSIPGSRKIVFIGSAHHSITAGPIVLLDPNVAVDSTAALTKLTPEVPYPEAVGFPDSYFTSAYPLSEQLYLVSWSNQALGFEGSANPANATGVYLFDTLGGMELLWRDEKLSSMHPMPLTTRPLPAPHADTTATDGQEGRMLLLNVYSGLPGAAPGSVKALRVVAVPAKTHPSQSYPTIGVMGEDPGKLVLGTVPVQPDGSACFRVPSGVNVFFQALDADGAAIRTMRTITYVQPGQTLSCVGCHDPRNVAPANTRPMALKAAPSKLHTGPDGSWPMRFDRLVQPVLDANCTSCHKRGAQAAKLDLTGTSAWKNLVDAGKPSIREQVRSHYYTPSMPGKTVARDAYLLPILKAGHYGVKLSPADIQRLTLWLDLYAQNQGFFSDEQEKAETELRKKWAELLE
jgi:hypothetical protein